MYNFANLLTFSRILMIPLIVGSFYLEGDKANWIGFAIFSIAGITDFFDGYIARKYNMMSDLGKFMDPIADKLLIAAALLMMVAFHRIDGLAVIAAVVILCRELVVSGLREFLAELKVSVPVSLLAKWKTTLQIVALGFLLIGDAAPDFVDAVVIGTVCLWVAAILTLYTGYDYLKVGLRHMTE